MVTTDQPHRANRARRRLDKRWNEAHEAMAATGAMKLHELSRAIDAGRRPPHAAVDAQSNAIHFLARLALDELLATPFQEETP